jgi:4-carboxymuconolactone decarboxylase
MKREKCRESYLLGLNFPQHVMGERHVKQAVEQASDFSRPIQEIVTEYAWGKFGAGLN